MSVSSKMYFRLELAETRCLHGEWSAALADLNEVEALAPGHFSTDFLRGRILLGGGNAVEARAALDRLIAREPGHSRAITWRARASRALGDMEAAVTDYRAALQMTDRPEPDLVQETADALAAHGRVEEAVEVLGQGIARLGNLASLVLKAMELELFTGRFDAALSRVAVMQQSAPRPEPWMARRASILGRAGRTAAAQAAWRDLLTHLAALPSLERGSHAMSLLAEQARQALSALSPTSLSALPR